MNLMQDVASHFRTHNWHAERLHNCRKGLRDISQSGEFKGLRPPNLSLRKFNQRLLAVILVKTTGGFFGILQNWRNVDDLPNWLDFLECLRIANCPGIVITGLFPSRLIVIADASDLAPVTQPGDPDKIFPQGGAFWPLPAFRPFGYFDAHERAHLGGSKEEITANVDASALAMLEQHSEIRKKLPDAAPRQLSLL